MKGTRTKLSITLAPELVRAVDRAAKAVPGGSRSSVIETWLRRASRLNQEDRLRADTIAYHEGRAENERSEDATLAQASSRAARKLEYQLANDVIVVPCSSTLRIAPTHVVLRKGEAGVRSRTTLKCEQMTTLPRDDLERSPLGNCLSSERVAAVERGVLRAIGIAVTESE